MWQVSMRRLALALVALVVLLAACSKDQSDTAVEILQGVQIVSRISNVALRADTLIVSDVVSVEGGTEPSLSRYTCTGQSCTRAPAASAPLVEPLLALTGVATDPRTSYTNVGERHGVGFAQHSTTTTRDNVEWTFANYGAWIDHSVFQTTIASATRADNLKLHSAHSLSFGDNTGGNPPGDAVWRGVMLGNTRHGTIQPLRGDATLQFTLADNKLAVQFQQIKNLATNAAHPDMAWADIDVADGKFQVSNLGYIAGTFYGPKHSEVGGVFTHPTAVGAFGARNGGVDAAAEQAQ